MPIFSTENQKKLTHKRLKELVDYDPESGYFSWKFGRPGASMGVRCGTVKKAGYTILTLDRTLFRAHRVAWFFVHGEWPKDEIDHINRMRSDNRLANLRIADRSKNGFNKPVRSDSKIGVKNVSYDQETGVYYVRLVIDKKPFNFGGFATIGEAAACAATERLKHHQLFFHK